MHKRHKIIVNFLRLSFVSLFFLLTSFSLQAQDEKRTVSLQDAINLALKQHRDAVNASLDVENSEYQIMEVRSRALPQVSLNGTLNYSPLLQKSALPNIFGPNPNPDETILVAFGQKWNSTAGVNLTQNIFDKSVFTGLKAARTTREFYQLNKQLTSENIIEAVASAYYQVLVQRHKVGLLDTTIANAEKIQGVMKGLYDNGLAKKIDLDRMEVNISNLISQRQQLMNAVTLLENQLKFLMGEDINTAIIIPEENLDAIVPVAVPLTETAAVDNRTELQLLKKQEQLLVLQKESYKSALYPTLSLSANYSYMGMGNTFPVFKGKDDGVNWFDFSTISLNLRIPLFSGFANKARIQQADISLRKNRADQNYTKLALSLEFENAKTQINNNLITINHQRRNLELAREVFENTHNNYLNGLASLTDLLDAENSLTEANNNYSQALLDYRLAEIRMLKANGRLETLINK